MWVSYSVPKFLMLIFPCLSASLLLLLLCGCKCHRSSVGSRTVDTKRCQQRQNRHFETRRNGPASSGSNPYGVCPKNTITNLTWDQGYQYTPIQRLLGSHELHSEAAYGAYCMNWMNSPASARAERLDPPLTSLAKQQ